MVLLLKSVSLFSILLMIKPPRIPTIAAADCDIDVKKTSSSRAWMLPPTVPFYAWRLFFSRPTCPDNTAC